jgi:hypothetical protein
MARELWDDMIDREPEAVRSSLRLPSDAPIVVAPDMLKRHAWVLQIQRAVEVRTLRECDHARRIAWLGVGLLSCPWCAGELSASLAPREEGDCDVCGSRVGPFTEIEHKIGERRAPTGIYVVARVCCACGDLWRSLKLPPGAAGLSLN